MLVFWNTNDQMFWYLCLETIETGILYDKTSIYNEFVKGTTYTIQGALHSKIKKKQTYDAHYRLLRKINKFVSQITLDIHGCQ